MTFEFHKYRKRYASIALFSYMFLVALTIFHYHHVDLQEGHYSIESGQETEAGPFDKIIDLTHECTIHQFANTVINFNLVADLNLLKVTSEHESSLIEIVKQPTNPHYNSNPHRAPPSLI